MPTDDSASAQVAAALQSDTNALMTTVMTKKTTTLVFHDQPTGGEGHFTDKRGDKIYWRAGPATGKNTTIEYVDHGRNKRHYVKIGRRSRSGRRSRRDDDQSSRSGRESSSSGSNRTHGRRSHPRHSRSPRPRRNSGYRGYTYDESETDESSESSSVAVQREAPAAVNPYTEFRDSIFVKTEADECTPEKARQWRTQHQSLVPSALHWKKSLNDHLARTKPGSIPLRMPEDTLNHVAYCLAIKQAGGASNDNLQAFTDAALDNQGLFHPDREAWKNEFATLVPRDNADDFPEVIYRSWVPEKDPPRTEMAMESRNWAEEIVSRLPGTLFNDENTATYDKTIERIVNTATQLTDQRRTDRRLSKLAGIVNKFIHDCGGTEELSRADLKNMRSSIESLNRRKKSMLEAPLYPALNKLVETAFTRFNSERAHRSRRTRTRPSRPHDGDTDRRQVRLRTHSDPTSRRRSSNVTPRRRRNSAETSHTGRSRHDSRRRPSRHRSRPRRDERRDYEEYSDDYSTDRSSTGSGYESRGRTRVQMAGDAIASAWRKVTSGSQP